MKFHHLKFEYWPWKVVYAPIAAYYVYNSIKARNPYYFFSTNPGIETGGLLIESKYDILQKLPKTLIPKSILVHLHPVELQEEITTHKITYPFIIKPNFGERGVSVAKINNNKELQTYIKQNRKDVQYIIQPYIYKQLEVAVFYYRLPHEKKGRVSSLVVKEFLTVIGNGKDTIQTLLEHHKRAPKFMHRLQGKYDPHKILLKGEEQRIMPIGSHNLGTTFFDGTQHITPKLVNTFDTLAKKIDGFYYGRFDIRADSMKDIEQGKFIILELNGAKAEPVHIYHPNYSVHKAYKALFEHWRAMYVIAKDNNKKGYHYPSLKEGRAAWKKYKKYH